MTTLRDLVAQWRERAPTLDPLHRNGMRRLVEKMADELEAWLNALSTSDTQQAQPDEKPPKADSENAHSREYVAAYTKGYNEGFERAAAIARDRIAQQAQPCNNPLRSEITCADLVRDNDNLREALAQAKALYLEELHTRALAQQAQPKMQAQPTREQIEALKQSMSSWDLMDYGDEEEIRRESWNAALDKVAALYDAAPRVAQTATDELVERFAEALKDKLRAAEAKYGWNDGWKSVDWADDLRTRLREHVEKGDPRDVAAFCAFAWHHGWSLAPRVAQEPTCEVCAGIPKCCAQTIKHDVNCPTLCRCRTFVHTDYPNDVREDGHHVNCPGPAQEPTCEHQVCKNCGDNATVPSCEMNITCPCKEETK